MEEEVLQSTIADGIVLRFDTYEEYLDSQIQERDLYYLEDQDLARELVERGYHGCGDVLRREDFERRKRAAENLRQSKIRQPPQVLAHEGKDLSNRPLLQELAHREKAVRAGKLAVIIFLRTRNQKGNEISGYIDYGHRLKTEDFSMYFSRRVELMPKTTDLSYYNWETQVATSNSTPNFDVIADNGTGLQFKNKRDRKTINVEPQKEPGDLTRRIDIDVRNVGQYLQAVLYVHETRRKN
eukprot:gnl/Trimastix_PCT/1569.p1 GENE.gnl/Trimastix_PCT/1569~~gnl/Trimastix_PCT/1569.p1  ORF type:complete len:240 (+),score=62.83 gnl/Trimastix_PCT/1569:43-762(+)